MLPHILLWKTTYASDDGSVVLLALIDSDGFIVGACGKDTAVVVDTSSDEFLPVWRVCEVSRTRGVCEASQQMQGCSKIRKYVRACRARNGWAEDILLERQVAVQSATRPSRRRATA